MKKVIAICLVFMLCLLPGCKKKSDAPSVTGLVEIVYKDQKLVSETVTTNCENVEDVILEVCQKHKIAYRLDNHFFDGFGGYSMSDSEAWMLYVNGEKASKGAYEIKLENDFEVVFSYENWLIEE